MMASNQHGLAKFCNETSLPGWAYLNRDIPKLWKALWALFLIAILIISVYFFYRNTSQYLDATTLTTIKTTMASLEDFKFPSVLICNINQLTKSFMLSLGANGNPQVETLIIEEFIKGVSSSNRTPEELEILSNVTKQLESHLLANDNMTFIELATQKCSDLLIYVAHPSSMTAKMFFNAYKEVADFGACCYIEPYLNFVNPQTANVDMNLLSGEDWHAIPRGSQNGELGGVEFLLDAESFAFSSKEKNSIGFRIAFSDPQDKPTVRKDGYLISTGTYSLATIKPVVFNTTENVVTSFTPLERGCYTEKEFQLNILKLEDGYRYSIRNCLYSSVIEKIMENCSCTPNVFQTSQDYLLQMPCRGEGLACSDAWLLKLGNEELFEATDINNSTKQCLPSCEYETITTSISSASFPLLESFHHTSYFCFVLAKLARICRNPQRAAIFEQSHLNEITCQEIKNAFQSNLLCSIDQKPLHKIIEDYPKIKSFAFSYAKKTLQF